MKKLLTLLSPQLPSFSISSKWSEFDLLRSRLWLIWSCPFLSLSLPAAEMLCLCNYVWPASQTCLILTKEASRDLALCLSTSLSDLPFLPRRLRTLSTLPYLPKARQVEERWSLLVPGPLSLRQHSVLRTQHQEKTLGISSDINIWLERLSTSPGQKEPFGF